MKTSQPDFYKVISHSLINQSLSHAFLLSGEADLLSCAYWLSGVIISQSLKDDEISMMVEKLKARELVDFMLIDGSKGTIKKEVFETLQQQFSKSALEVTNKKVVIIHQVHQATSGALNSVLKFIEEPPKDTYFVLTTSSMEQMLETIVSRCVSIRLESLQEDFTIEEVAQEFILNHLRKTCFTKEQALDKLGQQEYASACNTVLEMESFLPLQPAMAVVNWQLSTDNNRNKTKIEMELLIELIKTMELDIVLKHQLLQTLTDSLSKYTPYINASLWVDDAGLKLQEVFNGSRI